MKNIKKRGRPASGSKRPNPNTSKSKFKSRKGAVAIITHSDRSTSAGKQLGKIEDDSWEMWAAAHPECAL